MIVLYFLVIAVVFYIGVLFGGHDMKKAYGIPRTMGVEEFKDTYVNISEYSTYADTTDIEEDTNDGINLT